MKTLTGQLQYTLRWNIHEGRLDDFKALAAEASSLVADNEPNMLGYHWYLDADQQHCTTIEQYRGAEHVQTHLANVGPLLPKFLEVADFTIEVYGDVNNEARAALDPLGPVYNDHLVGFSRY